MAGIAIEEATGITEVRLDSGLAVSAVEEGAARLGVGSRGIEIAPDIWLLGGVDDPVDGPVGTGAPYAGTGSRYVETANGDQYINVGTMASPRWVLNGPKLYAGTIERTDTTPKLLFSIHPGLTLVAIGVQGPDSDAASASLSIGKTPGGTDYLDAWNVKLMTGIDDAVQGLGPVGATFQDVHGVYAESGNPSTLGGPWHVTFQATP